ncbi:MAG: LuxR C-terminal-related transcriptional regulator, partial [Actinomycetota bacterium]|nr:LuxR C-terminal-related transcriptional regulator [Actinomycetota bacterium]
LELLVARATALGAAGQLSESHAALEGALERLPPDAGTLRVQLTAFAAGVEMLMGDARRARDRLVRALAQLDRADSIEAATLQVELGALGMFTSDFGPMRAYAEEALLISQSAGHRPLELVAAGVRAYAAGALVEPNAADALARAARLFDQTDDATLAQRLDAGIYLSWSEVLLERFDDSERHLRRALDLSRATGQGQVVLPLILGQLVPSLWRGRIVEAIRRIEAAVEAARLGGSSNLQAWALFAQAWASTYAGQFDRAIGLGEEVAALLRGRSPTVVSTAAKMFHGLALLEAGRAAQARRELLEALAGPKMPSYGATALFELLTRTELALGNLPAAEGWAAQAETSARAGGLALQACLAGRARAAALIAHGNFDDAADVALAAASAGERVRSAVEAARARTLAGQALAHAGQRDRAVTELQRAETTLTECGAAGFAAQASAELRRLGRRPVASRPRVGVARPEALTEREREIAALVAGGRTNREIAAECYLSEKTVEAHLSRIFVKWGISSRAALAGLISRQHERKPGG